MIPWPIGILILCSILFSDNFVYPKNDRPGDDGTLRIVKLLVFLLGVIDLASVSRIERELGGLEECVFWLWSVHGSIRERFKKKIQKKTQQMLVLPYTYIHPCKN